MKAEPPLKRCPNRFVKMYEMIGVKHSTLNFSLSGLKCVFLSFTINFTLIQLECRQTMQLSVHNYEFLHLEFPIFE